MRNKLFLTSASLILSACIFISNLSVLAGTSPASATSPTVYEHIAKEEYDANGELLYNGYLNVAGLNIDIKPGLSLKTFDKSMEDLNDELVRDSKTGASSTQVSFDTDIANANDKAEHTLNVQVDFAGKVLAQPLNVVFVMDQSGSLNMYTHITSNTTATSPDMNPNHYYRTTVKLTYEGGSGTYDYYHSPQLSGVTGAWSLSSTAITNYAKNGDLVSPGLVNSYINPTSGDIAAKLPEDSTGYKKITDVSVTAPNASTLIFSSTQALGPIDCTFLSGTDESTEGFPFTPYTPPIGVDKSWQYYSPELFTSKNFYSSNGTYNNFDSEAYVNNMLVDDRAYDRMLLSKILFKDLSNIIVADNENLPTEEQNKIGYVQFAASAETYLAGSRPGNPTWYFDSASRGLETGYFDDPFTRTRGFYGTNYYAGFEKAKEFFKDEEDANSDRNAKNLVIFVSDGAPNAPTTPTNYANSSTFRRIYMNDFVNDTNSIVYFAGIDLNSSDYTSWSAAIATKNPESTSDEDMYLSSNGNTLSELIDIRNQIEELVNAASFMQADIDPLFKLRVDETHPIELTYKVSDETQSNTISYKDMLTPGTAKVVEDSNGVEIGTLLYNQTNKTLTWEITHPNVAQARMSFYEELDETEINWADIASGNTQTADVLTASTVDFIDELGFARDLNMQDQGVVNISGNSQLRIENVSNPQSGVEVPTNSTIGYEIKVTNESITTGSPIDAENVLVVQKIPENTTYVSHTVATITGSGTSRTITGDYDRTKDEIRFEIPTLKANETLTFNYTAKVTSEYDKTIISVSQLGISDKPATLDENAYPLLHALNLVHTTPNAPLSTPTPEPTATPEPSSEPVITPTPTAATTSPTATPVPGAGTTTPTPTAGATPLPIPSATSSPSAEPSPEPSEEPTPEPSPEPSPVPSSIPLPPDDGGSGEDIIEPDKVEIGGNELSENDYSIGEDGTITISPDYIATLPDGKHVIRVTSTEGDVYESTIIVEDGVPLSATPFEYIGGAAWSLFDLIMTVVACILAISYFIIRPKKNEDEDDEYENRNTEKEKAKHKTRLITNLILFAFAIFSVILLFITQDFTQPMIVFDRWSVIFALVALIQAFIMFFIRKKTDDEEEQANQSMTF